MKIPLLLGLALSMLGLSAVSGEPAHADSLGKSQQTHHSVHGVIEAAHADKADDGAGHIILEVEKSGHQGQAAQKDADKRIKVSKDTRIELIGGNGKQGATTKRQGSFQDLQPGEHVSVTLEGHKALEIKIHQKKSSTTSSTNQAARTSGNSGTTAGNQPASPTATNAGTQSGVVSANRPESGTGSQPVALTANRPTTNAGGQPTTLAFKRPATNANSQPVVLATNRPATNTASQSATNTGSWPELHAAERPALHHGSHTGNRPGHKPMK